MNVTDMAVLSAKAIDKRRGENVTIIDIGGKSSIADYMILGSGASERLIAALRDEVEETLAKEGIFVKTRHHELGRREEAHSHPPLNARNTHCDQRSLIFVCGFKYTFCGLNLDF